MKRDSWRMLLVICCTSLIAGGCANKEMVRKEEQAVAAAQPAAVANAKAKEGPVKAPLLQESTAKGNVAKDSEPREKTEQITPLSNAAKLRAELQQIYFDFDSALLSPAARKTLSGNAELILKSSVEKITIEGHCDERGSDEYNVALGEMRAKAARNYLTTMGVSAARLYIISYGREKPADPGHDEAAWAKNRRCEFVITE